MKSYWISCTVEMTGTTYHACFLRYADGQKEELKVDKLPYHTHFADVRMDLSSKAYWFPIVNNELIELEKTIGLLPADVKQYFGKMFKLKAFK